MKILYAIPVGVLLLIIAALILTDPVDKESVVPPLVVMGSLLGVIVLTGLITLIILVASKIRNSNSQ